MGLTIDKLLSLFKKPISLNTGIRPLDTFHLVRGGSYGIITAEQKIGKTTFIDGHIVANAVLRGYPVLYISMEGGIEMRILNIMSKLLGVRLSNEHDVEDNAEAITDKMQLLDRFLTMKTGRFTIQDIEMAVSSWRETNRSMIDSSMGIVIVDNLANIHSEFEADVRRLIEYSSKYMTALAREDKHICAIAVQHQSVFAKDQIEATVNTLGDCRTTPRDVDWMLAISAPHKYTNVYAGVDITDFDGLFRVCRLIESRLSPKGMRDLVLFNPKLSTFLQFKEDNYQMLQQVIDEAIEETERDFDETEALQVMRKLLN